MNPLTIKIGQSLRRFSQNGRLLESLIMKSHSEIHENSTVGLVADVCDKRTDGWV